MAKVEKVAATVVRRAKATAGRLQRKGKALASKITGRPKKKARAKVIVAAAGAAAVATAAGLSLARRRKR
jgi:hypothetical protein